MEKLNQPTVDVFVRPDIRRKRVAAQVTASTPGIVRLTVAGKGYQVEGEPGVLNLDLPDFEPWSPEHPTLYTLECELLHDSQSIARKDVIFAMREFSVVNNHFTLNGSSFFARMASFSWPNSTFEKITTLDRFRTVVLAAREAGFNMLHVIGTDIPDDLLTVADETGLLVIMDAANEASLEDTILSYRNHPSLAAWRLLDSPEGERSQLLFELDPSRVAIIIDNTHAVVRRPYHKEHESCHIFTRSAFIPINRDDELHLLHNGNPSELSLYWDKIIGFIPENNDVSAELESGFVHHALDRVFEDVPGMTRAMQDVQMDAFRRMIDALRANDKIAGYCLGPLCDSSSCRPDGMLDPELKPRPLFDVIKRMQGPLHPVIHLGRTNLVPREEVSLTTTLANELNTETFADISLQVIGPTNQVLWKKKRGAKLPKNGKELWSGSVSASGSAGVHRFAVRLMNGMTRLAENSIEMHVFDPTPPSGIEVHVLDRDNAWQPRMAALAQPGLPDSPIHIVPPLANTIRAYPDNDLLHILAQVNAGAVALIFGPPDDWNDLAGRLDPALLATPTHSGGANVFHYVKFHPVFDGLPARCFMRQAYRNVVPPKSFLETSDEDVCGTVRLSQDADSMWGSDILVKRYGSGRVMLTHLRVLENLGTDPVADRLFVNLLRHFVRRSVPSEGLLPQHQEAVEWLRKERNNHVRRWMVIGMFPNWTLSGHDAVYPPERELDFSGVYPGWCQAVHWKPWYSYSANDYAVDMDAALTFPLPGTAEFDYGTAYAYTEITSERRQAATIHVSFQNATRLWFNGVKVHDERSSPSQQNMEVKKYPVTIKQGRNTLLLKLSKTPGPCVAGLDVRTDDESQQASLKWWK